MAKKLPQRIYVQYERPNAKEEYLVAIESIKDLDEENGQVGIYKLIETKTFVVERKLK